MKIQVGLFFGGKSVEHEISVISALQAAAAMDADKYQVIPIYITKDNEFYTGSDLLTPSHYRDLPALLARSQRIAIIRDRGIVHLLRYPAKLFAKPGIGRLDVAFPVIHGTNGEDGSLQGYFQLLGLPYVGSDVGASACGMDKWMSKCLLQCAGLPVLPGFCFTSASYYADPDLILRKLEEFHDYPLVVKPVNLGSSIGISAVHDQEELRDGIELAASFSERILVEPKLVAMREINCAVMGDKEHTEASACEEQLSTGELLSYRDKYLGGGESLAASDSAEDADEGAMATEAGAESGEEGVAGRHTDVGIKRAYTKSGAKGMDSALRKLPAELEKSKEEEIQVLAQKAFRALNCSGVARVDFLMERENQSVYINELNTIPGSLSFYLWEAAGKTFSQLTDELIQLALKRNRIQERLIWSNSVNLLSGMASGAKGAKGAKDI